ncbi:hypothetical protein B6U83_03465 [Thermoplasmatales archaeon ex4484_36]|nr:MAG: hypothetical protein B6U83_03465 [Thermoplasmatales archaeon ex4484_36]
MLYRVLAEAYSRAEETQKRLELLDIVVELLNNLGRTAEMMCKERRQRSLFSQPLTVKKVYGNFLKIAGKEGERSQEFKIKLIAELLNSAVPLEARYIIRTVSGRLRLGIADMTILDALSYRFEKGFEDLMNMCKESFEVLPEALRSDGFVESLKARTSAPLYALIEGLRKERSPALQRIYEKAVEVKKRVEENRQRIERAYNIYPDLGEIARRLVEGGLEVERHSGRGVRTCRPEHRGDASLPGGVPKKGEKVRHRGGGGGVPSSGLPLRLPLRKLQRHDLKATSGEKGGHQRTLSPDQRGLG